MTFIFAMRGALAREEGGEGGEVRLGFGEVPFVDGGHAVCRIIGADGLREDAMGLRFVHVPAPAMGFERPRQARLIDGERLAGGGFLEPDFAQMGRAFGIGEKPHEAGRASGRGFGLRQEEGGGNGGGDDGRAGKHEKRSAAHALMVGGAMMFRRLMFFVFHDA